MKGLAVACWLAMAGIAAGEEATYEVRGRRLPVEVTANGYVQSLTSLSDGAVRVQVATAQVPVGASGSYASISGMATLSVPVGFVMPQALREQLRPERESWEVATDILRWVAVNLRLDRGSGPQDAESVLSRGSGRCSGLANAAAAMLMASGFDARTVSGLLVTDDGPVAHRWIDCRLPGAGRVPSDPTLGLWVVSPRHLTFAETVTELPEVRVLRLDDRGLARLPRWRGIPVRPNTGSELLCRVAGERLPVPPLAILYGRGGDVHRAVIDPEARFRSLLPGRWRLVILIGSRVVEHRNLDLAADTMHVFTVEVPPLSAREVGS